MRSTHMKIENQNNLLGDSLMTGFGKLSNNVSRELGKETSEELGRIDPHNQIMDQQMSIEMEL